MPGQRAGGDDHLEVGHGALLDPLGLEQAPGGVQLREALLQLDLDPLGRLGERRLRGHIVAVGVELDLVERVGALAGQRVELHDALDLVAEQAEPPGAILEVGRKDLDRIAARAERAAVQVQVVALVLQLDQGAQQAGALDPLALAQVQHHLGVDFGRADAVDARHRGDDDHVVALEQRAGRRVAHAVDLLVDRRGLLDIRVRARHIRLGLVVIVVRDEVFDRIVREKALHLAIELGRQNLVGREDQRRLLHRRDDMGHRESLAGAGDAQQHLVARPLLDALDQLGDRLRLVARRLEIGLQDERDAGLRPLVRRIAEQRVVGQGLEQVQALLRCRHDGPPDGAAAAPRSPIELVEEARSCKPARSSAAAERSKIRSRCQ